jgi:predicted DNA-binding transcriptional regulator YafY
MATKSKRHPRLLELIAIGDSKEDIDSLAMALKVSSKTVRREADLLRSVFAPALSAGIRLEPNTDHVSRFREREVRTIASTANWEKQRWFWKQLMKRTTKCKSVQ